MRPFHVSVHHQLPQEEAISRIKHLFTNLRHEQKDKISNVKEHWEKETGTIHFTVRGIHLSAIVTVHHKSVEINAKIPIALTLFSGKIKELIKAKAMELLSE